MYVMSSLYFMGDIGVSQQKSKPTMPLEKYSSITVGKFWSFSDHSKTIEPSNSCVRLHRQNLSNLSLKTSSSIRSLVLRLVKYYRKIWE